MFLMLAMIFFKKCSKTTIVSWLFCSRNIKKLLKKKKIFMRMGVNWHKKSYFFWKILKINDHQSITIYISLLLEKGNKITILSWIFLWKLSKKWWKKSWDKRVFVILFFNVFEKYGHKTIVNLQQLFSKNSAKITIL